MHTSALHFRGVTGLASRRMGTEGVSKVMMIGGGTLVFSGFGGVEYTRGSVGTRWILSVHISVALSWRHWACVETNGYGGGEQGYYDRGVVRLGFSVCGELHTLGEV